MKKRKQNKKKIVGLTGGFGTGKSTVARMFGLFGARIIDADKISHGLIKPREEACRKIIRLFGKEILTKFGIINRRKLAGIVFSDRKSLAKINKIMHPAIIRRMKQEIKSAKEDIVVLDAPLLLETGLDRLVDTVVVVNANLDNQIKRIQKRAALSKSEIIARIKSQIPLKKKLHLADFVIDNNGTIQNTRKQVALVHCNIKFCQCTKRGCGGERPPRLGGAQRT